MELQLDSRNRRRVKYCPCNKNNNDGKFVPFKDSEKHGYCHSCDRTFLPEKNTYHDFTPIKRKKEIKPEFIKKEYLKSLLYDFEDDNNNFVHFLERTLGVNKTYKILKDYWNWSNCNFCIKFHNARSSDMEIRNVSIRCYRNNIWNNLANSNDHNNNHNWTLVLDGKEK